ncbi:MAG: Holliday junction branch migration protein RuvA, partial [Proteobacteria bacterium]
MISSLRGIIEEVSGNTVTLDVQGVGYEILCSNACLVQLSQGETIRMVIYTDVREDSIRLFGFEDQLEKQVFLLLMQVKGIGPRSSADIVSRINKRELLRAIGAGDVGQLQSVKGVGKKTAERIVVELKDKVAEFVMERQYTSLVVEREVVGPFEEAAQALQALGFSRRDAEKAIQSAQSQGLPASS